MFSLLIFTLLMVFPGPVIANAVFASNAQKNFLGFLAVGALSNALFNYLLIPQWGGVGASMATIIAQVLANGLIWWKMKKIADFRMLAHIQKIIFATIIMSLAVLLFQFWGVNIILNIVLAGGIYFLFLYALKEPLLDKSFVLSIFR